MNIRNQHHWEVVIIEWSTMTDCLCCEPSLDQVRWSSLSQCWWSRLVSPNGSLIWLVPAHHRTPLNLNSLFSLGVRHTTSAWRTRQIVAWRHESAHHSYIRILLINIYSEQNTQINKLITHKNTNNHIFTVQTILTRMFCMSVCSSGKCFKSMFCWDLSCLKCQSWVVVTHNIVPRSVSLITVSTQCVHQCHSATIICVGYNIIQL